MHCAWMLGLGALACAAPVLSQPDAALTVQPFTFTSRGGATVEAERCSLAVRYNRDDPDSELIQLRFVRFPTTAEQPGPPIVYLAGGPGGSGIGAAQGDRFELFMQLRAVGDVIAWDQRGAGASEPRHVINATVDSPYEGAVDPAWLCEQHAIAARAARAQFENEGISIAPLNTNASADDLEDLRIALGVPKLRLWAISYGTHLALATAKRYPDSIDSMVLAGVEGLDSTHKLPSQADAPMSAIAREVAADPVLGPMIPDFVSLVRQVLERAEEQPFVVEFNDPQSGEVVTTHFGRLDLESYTWGALSRRDRMAGLPALYLRLSQGDAQALAPFIDRSRGPGEQSRAMWLAMDCASGVSAERQARIDRETDASLFGRHMNFFLDCLCPDLGVPDLGDAFRAPVQSDMPVLCLSGEMDVRTPPSNAVEVLAGFPNGQHVIIERAAHDNDLLIASPQIAECILAFFRGEPIPHGRITLPPVEFLPPDALDAE